MHTWRADARAAACDAGAEGERRTAVLLSALPSGWRVLHDRRIPGLDRANADHIVVSPGARVFLVDSKMWSAKHGRTVYASGGHLWHGEVCKDLAVRSLLAEANAIEQAVGVPVQPLMAIHNAPVHGREFAVGGAPVFTAGRLVPLLAANDDARTPGARAMADAVEAALPPYRP